MHIGPRDHDVAHASLAQIQGTDNEALFPWGKQAVLPGLTNLHLQFLGGVGNGMAGDEAGDAKRADNLTAESFEQNHSPAKRGEVPIKWPGN